MKEDLKILEELIEGYKDCSVEGLDMQVDVSFREKQCNAIEHLIKEYKQLEKENKSKQKAYDDCYCEYKHYKQFDSIPKSRVEEKIEELKGTEELLSDEQGYWGGSDLLAKIEVLQDLLERSREDE